MMLRYRLLCSVAVLFCLITSVKADWSPKYEKAKRGATIETKSINLAIRNGVVAGIVNKFTGEEYVDPLSNIDELLKHLPAGIGTQHGEEEREKAFELFHYPWAEHSIESRWPNQHFPDSKSVFEYKKTDAGVQLIYKGLTDGDKRYPDESYILNITVDDNGDVAITPEAKSPRGGVYGVNLTVAPLMPAITVEAPIFDGIKITRDMQPMLWNALWANYWDYAFVALNGWKKGAIGIWCPDKELKYSKSLYHMVNDEGLSLSFHGMNIPPYEESKEAKPVTWKIQAFANGWSEAAAHFREWRLANVKIAKRPDWAKRISFVNMGVNANKIWLDLLSSYFEGKNLDRTLTFAAVIREEGFDRNHANNKPYKGFKDDMKAWKASGAKLMAYLNPVIMWSPNPQDDREHHGVAMAKEAKTIMPFQGANAKPVAHFDVQHLGHAEWQRWFLDWVKEYIQDNGSDGIYHDEGQKTPLDNRGLVNGMTPTMGRADYHYKAQAENSNSVHGAEHQTSANNTGVSFSIGGGILWGTTPSMRHQRIKNASAVSNSLHYPNGTIRAFPHYSEFHSRGNPQNFHWGMDQQEKRAEIAGHSIQNNRLFKGETVPFDQWVNELWIERTRAMTFVRQGLRPYYPENWDKDVVSYFRAADGGDFRYMKYDWGSALVELGKDGEKTIIYARIHGVPYAKVGAKGGIPGWPIYNELGPAGLDPYRYYCYDPNLKRPDVHFRTNNTASPSFNEAFADSGFINDTCAALDLKARPDIGGITLGENVILVSDVAPLAIWVNGKPQKIEQRVISRKWEKDENGKRKIVKTYADDEYQINFRLPAKIAVLLKQPAQLAEVEKTIFARYASGSGPERRPIFADSFITGGVERSKLKLHKKDHVGVSPIILSRPGHLKIPHALFDIAIPVALPKDALKGNIILTAEVIGNRGGFLNILVNGEEAIQRIIKKDKKKYLLELRVPLEKKTPNALIQFESEAAPVLNIEWQDDKKKE